MSGIPLPALSVHTEQPDVLSAYAKVAGIKSMLNQQQGQHLELQQKQLDLEDQQKFRQAFQQAGGDPDKTVQLATQLGVGPRTLTPYVTGIADYKKKVADATKVQQEVYANEADLMQGAHDTIAAAPPEARPARYQEQLQALKAAKVDISKLPPQYPGDEQFAQLGPVVQGHKILTEQALKEAQAKDAQAKALESAAKLPGEQAESAQRQRVLAGTSPTGVTAEQQATLAQGTERIALEKKNVALSAGRLTEEKRHNQATEGQLTPEALDMAADSFAKTGQLPQVGRSGAVRAQIINKAAEKNPQLDPVKNAGEYQANLASLKKIQPQYDAVTAFEGTAGKNLDLFLDQAKKVIDTGSPLINAPLRVAADKVFGSKDQAAYNAARQVAINEIAKVTGSPGLTGQLSDSARHEVEAFNPNSATLKQTYAVAKLLRQDMENRRTEYEDQINAIQSRLASRGNGNSPAGAPPAAGGFNWNQFPEHKVR